MEIEVWKKRIRYGGMPIFIKGGVLKGGNLVFNKQASKIIYTGGDSRNNCYNPMMEKTNEIYVL